MEAISQKPVDPFSEANPDELEEFQALKRALELGHGFKLIFARCEYGNQRDAFIEQLQQELSRREIMVVRFGEQDRERVHHLLDELRERLENRSTPPEIMVVAGLEHLLPRTADVFKTPVVSNLNAARNSFPSVVPCPMVLWCPDYVLRAVTKGAPDFFSIRSGVYFFVSHPKDVAKKADQVFRQGTLEISRMKMDERRERLHEIDALLSDYRSLKPDQQPAIAEARLLVKKGNLCLDLRDWDAASASFQQALDLSRALHHPLQADSLHGLGRIAQELRRWEQAEEFYRNALGTKIDFNDRYGQAGANYQLGRLAEDCGNTLEAVEFLLKGLQIFVEFNDRERTELCLRRLAELWKKSGDSAVLRQAAQIMAEPAETIRRKFQEHVSEFQAAVR